jgi:hypothetical protein
MLYGTCEHPLKWYVYDNEFYLKNSTTRIITGNYFNEITDTMFHFPHAYFDPKTGPIIMCPNYITGNNSQIIYMYDYKITNVTRINNVKIRTTQSEEIRKPTRPTTTLPQMSRQLSNTIRGRLFTAQK